MKNDLPAEMRTYFEERGDDLDAFAKRHRRRFGREFLVQALAGGVRDDHPALKDLRRIVAFGPDLRRDRIELSLSASKVALATRVSPGRLSRAERLKGELRESEKKCIDRFVLRCRRERDRLLKIDNDKAVGRALRGARIKAGLTQAQLATDIRMKRKSIMRWESGAPIPDTALELLVSRLD